MNDFIEKYRWLILGVLVLLIVAGTSLIIWDRYNRLNIIKENKSILELQAQNELLRQQLSNQSSTQVAGAITKDESNLVNINSATAEELDKLPGIGPARASDIIAYREENGAFGSIEELKNISGIGDKTFENLKDLVTVGD